MSGARERLFGSISRVLRKKRGKRNRKSRSRFPKGTETLLIIEDEESVRKVLERAMRAYGYKVLLAADGAEGYEIYSRERDRIDLTVLDLLIPHMSGREFLERLRAENPDAKVIVSTGPIEQDEQNAIEKLRPAKWMLKPYDLETLDLQVREVLDADNG
ncbi:MAG: response regulator [bacterium]